MRTRTAMYGGNFLMRKGAAGIAILGLVLILGLGAFFFLPRTVKIEPTDAAPASAGTSTAPGTGTSTNPATGTAQGGAGTSTPVVGGGGGVLPSDDLPPQPQLPNPPVIVKGIYMTGWTAGYEKRLNALIDLVDRTELNAVVIDIKDYSGYVSYKTGVREFAESGAENELRISRPNTLIKRLHDKGIYVIARVSVFQDPILAKAHPEWAVQNSKTGKLWVDRKGLAWMDAGAKPVWDYHVALAKDAFARGFDEVNFDYIRFPSDGDMTAVDYPFTDESRELHATIAEFFAYLRRELPGQKISADLFGLTTSSADDLGIGQKIEDAYPNFDYVCPMVYPSHFASGYNGFKSPAEHPYEVIQLSMTAAVDKLERLIRSNAVPLMTTNNSSTASSSAQTPPLAPITAGEIAKYGKLRPWLQVFDLGAVYDEAKVKAQIKAADDVLAGTPYYAGWLLWDPANNYKSYR